MNKWGWFSLVSLIIIVGLVLKFGKTSSTILKDVSSTVTSGLQTLTLSNLPGNAPA